MRWVQTEPSYRIGQAPTQTDTLYSGKTVSRTTTYMSTTLPPSSPQCWRTTLSSNTISLILTTNSLCAHKGKVNKTLQQRGHFFLWDRLS